MPGFNQRGPFNEGPMTGGARGYCRNAAGQGRQFSGGRRQRNQRGCRYPQMQFDSAEGQRPMQEDRTKESLKNRARFLEEELASVKKDLEDLSD